MSPQDLLVASFRHALGEIAPERLLPAALPEAPRGRTIVVGAGKAAASMARAVEENWRGPLSGLVVAPYGYGLECEQIRVLQAAHPVPDELGLAAARDILLAVRGLTEDDLVLGLFSGGGSALLPLPAEGITLDDKKWITTQLLQSGAPIREVNTVRKHLSAIKGGRLACACAPAELVNLLISDVSGDDPSAIASGPGVPDPSNLAAARYILERYGIVASDAIRKHLSDEANETPKPGDRCFARVSTRILCSSQSLLESASRFLESQGVASVILSDSIEGEAREVGLVMAAIARQMVRYGQPVRPPCAVLSGGETTVTVHGAGKGGRNTEFLLSLVLALGADVPYAALACDTDGIDGPGGAAGAVAGSDTLVRASAAGLDARRMLDANDSYPFFEALGQCVVTGPTFNNVNDFRAVVVSETDSRKGAL